MEIHTQLLKKAAIEGFIKYHPRCAKLKITHLSFADDLGVFSDADSGPLLSIKSAHNEFYSISGILDSLGTCLQ